MLTTDEVARELKVTPRRVLAIAKARGVEPAIDTPRFKLWRPAQVEKLRPGPAGRPSDKRPPKKKR